MIILNQEQIHKLALGSTLLATGGGFPYKIKLDKLLELQAKRPLKLVSANELSDQSLVCAVSGIGSAANTKKNFDISLALKKGLDKIEKTFQKKIIAFVPGEIGIENIIFELASEANLPVLDADTAGQRAVPEMTHDTFFAAEESILPAILVNLAGQIKIIDQPGAEFQVEKLARKFANESPEKTILIFSHIKPISIIKKIIALNSLSNAIKVGEIIQLSNIHKIKNELKYFLKGEIATQGVVVQIQTKKSQGFLVQNIHLSTDEQLHIKNEVLALTKNQTIHFTVPDSLCLCETSTGFPIHSSELAKGQHITVFKIPAIPQWKTTKGLELFGLNYVTKLI